MQPDPAPSATGVRKAVVVGIDAYGGSPYPDLGFCAADAEAVAQTLSEPDYGFEVTLLLDSDATRGGILEAVTSALSHDHVATFAFFFAGHGDVTEVGEYLITSDSRPFDFGIELNLLVELLTRFAQGGTDTVAFLDCCQAGAVRLPNSALASAKLDPAAIELAFRHGAGSRAVLAACLADQSAEEIAAFGHGRFTYHLLEGLYGAAADATGRVTPSSLHDYVSPHLISATGQTPAYYAALAGSLTLAEGFPPQIGPLPDEQAFQAIEAEADVLREDFRVKLNSEAWSDWGPNGFAEACALLTQILEWFDRQCRHTPALELRPRFVEARRAVLRQRGQIGVLESGVHLPEGVVDTPIGSGGFGTVWTVVGPAANQTLAYKVYHSQDLGDLVKSSRFRRGFDAMQRLHHRRVVAVTRFTEVPLGFLMEYIHGANLRDVNPAQTQEPLAIMRILIAVAEAVAHAHSRGVVHRDIKPENIVCRFTEGGAWEPYLTDFDLAWINTSSQVTREGIGNYLYAAPEQLMYFTVKAVTGFKPTLDVFSLGQLAYFCVTAVDPNPTRRDVNIQNMGRVLGGWPSGQAAARLAELYERATRESPKERFASMDGMLSELFEVQRSLLPEGLADHLSPGRFKAELVFAFTGEPVADEIGPETEFGSLSGQSRVVVTHRRRAEHEVDITLKLLPAVAIGIEGQTNEVLRRRLNGRVARVVEALDGVDWRPGNVGTFSVFVDVRGVRLDRDGLARVREILTKVLQVVEGAA